LDEARRLLRQFGVLGMVELPIGDSLFRVVGEPVTATEETPSFDRSTMDGFAVRAADTFGASESSPALFEVAGEVAMGEVSGLEPRKGQAVRIWTGGALPAGCDAVVMVEHTSEIGPDAIELYKAVGPFENVVRKGEDFKAGDVLLARGHRLRPQDLGFLAALGRVKVKVYQRPRVALISSGDEIVPAEQEPPPGCIRDVNQCTLTAMIREAHAEPVWIGIAPDRLDALTSLLDSGLELADLVVISGGSSMGSRDLVIEAIEAHRDSEILLHGVSVSPGKPLILAKVGNRPVFGLPGHPVSAMVCFEQFVVPLMRRLEGEEVLEPFARLTCRALLSRNLPSREGRMDYVRVRLERIGDNLIAVPVLGKSGMISAMVRAHGFIRIEADCEGLYKADEVTVHLFSDWVEHTNETEHLSGHEAARRSAGSLFETPRQERLSGF
jgi:molybdopterin molybdotransferase